MGRVINKGDVVSKVTRMNSEIENLRSTIVTTYHNLEKISSMQNELAGIAWNNFREYLVQVQLPLLDAFDYWAQLMIEANNAYAYAGEGLSVAILDEEELLLSKTKYLQQKSNAERCLVWAIPLNLGGIFFPIIFFCDTMIETINKKLLEIDDFDAATVGLFMDAESALSVLKNAEIITSTAIYDSQIHSFEFSSCNETVLCELKNTRLKKIQKDRGLKAEDIVELNLKSSYTEEELLDILHDCEGKVDSDFMINLLSRSYEQAFAFSTDKPSEGNASLLAHYMKKLYDSENSLEMERLNNAILKNVTISNEIQKSNFASEEIGKIVYIGNTAIHNLPIDCIISGSNVVYDAKEGFSIVSNEEYNPTYNLSAMTNEGIDQAIDFLPTEKYGFLTGIGYSATQVAVYKSIILSAQGDKSFKDTFAEEYQKSMDFTEGFQAGVAKGLCGMIVGTAEIKTISRKLFLNNNFYEDYKNCYIKALNDPEQDLKDIDSFEIFLQTESGQKVAQGFKGMFENLGHTITDGSPRERGELVGGVTLDIALTCIGGGESLLAKAKNFKLYGKTTRVAEDVVDIADTISDAERAAKKVTESEMKINSAEDAKSALDPADEIAETSHAQSSEILQNVEGGLKIDVDTVIDSASAMKKGGESVVGHALQKHAGRNPDIWGKIKGNATQINETAMNHLDDILRGPGEFKIVTTDKGVKFLEKILPDGRGIRLNMDGTFKGFIDQIK